MVRRVLLAACVVPLWACQEPPPRSFTEYLEDDVAREGTLARCNADRAATFDDLECRNARRAAAALAAQAEAERRARLEAESERKRAAARERIAAQQEAARRAAEAARRAAEAAYEDQFLYGGTKLETVPPPATDGEPVPVTVPTNVPPAQTPVTPESSGMRQTPAPQTPLQSPPEQPTPGASPADQGTETGAAIDAQPQAQLNRLPAGS